MKCPECGTENSENANFCEKCGKDLLINQTLKESVKSPKTRVIQGSKGYGPKILIAIVCIIGAIGIYTLAQANVVAAESIEPVMYPTMNVVVSGSMEPVMYRGDLVIVDNPSNIQVGDIIVYHAIWFDQPVIHRVIAIGKANNGTTYFIAKGDNNPVQDPEPIYQNQIISKAIATNGKPLVIPKIGYITLWIRGL